MKTNHRIKQVGILLLTMACLGGCAQNVGVPNASKTQDTVTKSAYEAKIAYYEACLQNLNQEIDLLDQQLYVMRAEYQNRTEALQQELGELRQIRDVYFSSQGTNTHPLEEEGVQAGNEKDTEDAATNSLAQKDETADPEMHPEYKQSGEYLYSEKEDGIILVKYVGEGEDVEVPGAIDGKKVVCLADSVFAESAVKAVSLPHTVTELGWFTFYGCKQLTSVTLPASINRIGYASFDGCGETLCLSVEKDSYAQKYAASFALRYITQ
jgi:hypothetical protein